MKPSLATSPVISEKRRAAARANGAKSRGPVTAQGRANSSRNSRRHGLRSLDLFDGPESADELASFVASYENEFQPQSEIEHTLIRAMALANWRRRHLLRLETELLNREVKRLKALTPDEDPHVLIALAFRALADHGCALHFINRIESLCERRYNHAWERLLRLQTEGRLLKKLNMYERTYQVVENKAETKAPNPTPCHQTAAAGANSAGPLGSA